MRDELCQINMVFIFIIFPCETNLPVVILTVNMTVKHFRKKKIDDITECENISESVEKTKIMYQKNVYHFTRSKVYCKKNQNSKGCSRLENKRKFLR